MENETHWLDETSKCPKCGKHRLGIIKMHGIEKQVQIMCECEKKEEQAKKEAMERKEKLARLQKLKSLSVLKIIDKDEKIREVRMSDLKETKENQYAIMLAKRYVDKFDMMKVNRQGLLFYGPVGTGKSFIATAIATELLEKEYPVVMTSFIQLLTAIRKFTTDEDELINRLNMADLLIIDDLGAENTTDYALEKVYNIIDTRYRCGKPVIITTNLTFEQMKTETDVRYERIYDRIFEMCYPIKIDGMSWRKKAAIENAEKMKRLMGE